MTFIEIISVLADLAIIFLLAVQSWVLVKLLPEIKRTAANSSFFTEKMNPKKNKSYPKELTDMGITNCKHYEDSKHTHTHECFRKE